MKSIAILCTLLLSLSLLAQKAPIKYGDVPIEDLKMKVYSGDSSAAAVVLADYGESSISYDEKRGFILQFKRIRRIKILKKEGYSWGNFTIPIFKKNNVDEKLATLKAMTVNLEGQKAVETKLGKDGIFTEAASENWDHIKITLPNVREGSVIDITYSINSPYWFNFQDWEFQSTIPVRWSEYIAQIPEYFQYQKFAQGYIAFQVNDFTTQPKTITLNSKSREENATTTFSTERIDYTENDFRWVAANVPAFKIEPYMTTYTDYISKVNFELAMIKIPGQPVKTYMGSWDNINKELLDATEFGGVVRRSGFLNKTAEEITGEMKTESEKLEAVYAYVKNNVEWDGTYRKYTDGNFKRVLEDRKGSSAEINLMLVSLLQKLEIKADPLVLSTRNHGFVRQQFPLSSQFNYVICAAQIDDKLLLLDATDRSLPITLLPERCLNGMGFLISEDHSQWIELGGSIKSRTFSEATVEFDEDGVLNGNITITKDGYHGQQMRTDFHSKGEEAYVKRVTADNGWSIKSSKFENLKDLNEPVKEVYELSLPGFDQPSADIIYLNPILGNNVRENPFKSERREYPVDFGSPFEYTSLVKIKVPTGYQVEELPQSIALALPNKGGRFFYNISNMNGMVSLTSQFIIAKGLYSQEEYQGIKEFYDQVVAKQNEQIVFKKMGE